MLKKESSFCNAPKVRESAMVEIQWFDVIKWDIFWLHHTTQLGFQVEYIRVWSSQIVLQLSKCNLSNVVDSWLITPPPNELKHLLIVITPLLLTWCQWFRLRIPKTAPHGWCCSDPCEAPSIDPASPNSRCSPSLPSVRKTLYKQWHAQQLLEEVNSCRHVSVILCFVASPVARKPK